MFILQYKVSTTVIDLVVIFALFVFVLVLMCFCVAAVSWRIKIYIIFMSVLHTSRRVFRCHTTGYKGGRHGVALPWR